jgi:hypothetical protein
MSAASPFELTPPQQERLLALRAAWEEGEDEERLDRLRQHEEDAETLRAVARLLATADLEGGGSLTRVEMAQFLALVRALAPNPNLDARLLRRSDEPETFNRDLRDLLYGPVSAPLRLRQFLTRRHAGAQTALQLLCAVYPSQWPLVTRAGLRTLDLSPEQRADAVQAARNRFDLPSTATEARGTGLVGFPQSDPILRLLADVLVYEAARELVEAADYVTLHRLLTRTQPTRSSARDHAALTASVAPPLHATVREPDRPSYGAHPSNVEEAAFPAAPAPDVSGLLQRDLLAVIEAEIAGQGFTYPPLAIRDYYLCLQSRGRLTILSGLSGTGKTQLSALFAAALTSNLAEQYRLLPVRPDWHDSTPLLGYVNLLVGGEGRFVSTPFLDFLRLAGRPQAAFHAYFLCLDEMNLARVEHYFAEVLSAMETPNRELLLPNGRAIRLPANLFITGTLNVDEGTHNLSRKVLDRANTILFNEVALSEEAPTTLPESPTAVELSPPLRQALFLQARTQSPAAARTKLRQVHALPQQDAAGEDLAGGVIQALAEANAILEPHDLHFAYRVRDEILIYCANSFDVDGAGLLTPETPTDARANLRIALDLQLTQKILPRLTGTQEQIEPAARDLLRWAQRSGFERTARRLTRLLTRLQRDGFVGLE